MSDFLLIAETFFDAVLFIALLASPFVLYFLAVMLHRRRRQRRIEELRQNMKRAYVEDLFRQIG